VVVVVVVVVVQEEENLFGLSLINTLYTLAKQAKGL